MIEKAQPEARLDITSNADYCALPARCSSILPKRRTHSDTDKAQRNRAISATKNDAAPKTADTTATTMEITVTL